MMPCYTPRMSGKEFHSHSEKSKKKPLTADEQKRYKEAAEKSNVLASKTTGEKKSEMLKGATAEEIPDTRHVETTKFAPPQSLSGAFYDLDAGSVEAKILQELQLYYGQKSTLRTLAALNEAVEEIGEQFGRLHTIKTFNNIEETIGTVQRKQHLSREDIAKQLKEVNLLLQKKKK